MTTSRGKENPYQAPQALLSQTNAAGSPWRRFWLSCLVWVLPLPALAILMVRFLPTWILVMLLGLVALWLATVTWIVRAHRNTGFAYRAAVAVGLTIVLAICFVFGSALLLAPILNKPIDITLPQRRT